MKKSVVVALHLGYWTCYCILLAFMYSILRMSSGGGHNPALHFTKLGVRISHSGRLRHVHSCYLIHKQAFRTSCVTCDCSGSLWILDIF
jgi:hypothetical protein